MSLSRRLDRLERDLPPAEPTAPLFDLYGTPDEDGLLAWFEALPADEFAAWEPDWPVALDHARAVFASAAASVDPPWEPPADFMTRRGAHPTPRFVRCECWRARHFPAAAAALGWLREIVDRIEGGIPPVTEGEWADLEEWLTAHAGRLDAIADKSVGDAKLLDVGVIGTSEYQRRHPVHVRSWMVQASLRAGVRVEGAGIVAETVRRLRILYPLEV